MRPLILAALMLPLFALSALAAEPRAFSMTVETPTAGWKLKIEKVYRVGKTPTVIARLTPPAGFAAQVMSKVSDRVSVEAPAGEPRFIVLGKDWNWENAEPYMFVEAEKSEGFLTKLASRKDAKLLWSAPEPAKPQD